MCTKEHQERFLNKGVAKHAILDPGPGPKSLSVLTNAVPAKTESLFCDLCDLPVLKSYLRGLLFQESVFAVLTLNFAHFREDSSRAKAALPRRHADTPIRRYADTPIRRYADTIAICRCGYAALCPSVPCYSLSRTARVLSSFSTPPGWNDGFAFGSVILSPSHWTLPCSIKRRASARDLVV